MNQSNGKISGAKLAEQLLGVGGQPRNIDHLIEELRPTTLTGWEGPLLEFKATYKPSPKFPDDPDFGQPDYFVWNVLHAFVAFANASGGCVILGIKEENGQLIEGDWDPEGVLQDPKREEKDLEGRLKKRFFRANENGAKRLSYKRNKTAYSFCIPKDDLPRLEKLVRFYCCRSQKLSCNAIVAIIQPILKCDKLISVTRIQNQIQDSVIYYRSPTVAETLEITDINELSDYRQAREPESAFCTDILNRPFKRTPIEESYFSTVPAPDPNFLGREGELARLHELCLSGKIPLIHAAGGTGKTQLAFKYAALHAKDYPGGRFYIPGENAANWDDAMRELISQRQYAHGTSPIDYLNLTAEKPSTAADIIQSLFQISARAGKILLVIDNIEKPGIFFADEKLAQTFPSEFTSSIAIVATSRTSKGIIRRAVYAKSIPLGDLTQDEALALLTGGEPFDSEQERTAAMEIIKLLENRALYVRRMARIVDAGSRRSYKRLYKKLQNDLLIAVQPQEGEDNTHTPEVIWKWTREHIANSPDGKQDIRLAQTIALFPANGVATRILEALWYSNFGELGRQETLDAYRDDSDLFRDALKRLSEYSLIQHTSDEHVVSMHRLDSAAIRKQLQEEKTTWLQTIGKALSACPCVEIQDWVDLAKAKSELFDFCPVDVLDANCWAVILVHAPQYQSMNVPWESFSQNDWTYLLSHHPEFADNPHLDNHYIPRDILIAQPSLMHYFSLPDLSGRIWARLVVANPILTPQCPWERLRHADWLCVLKERPDFGRYCHHPEMLHESASIQNDEKEHVALGQTNSLHWPYFLRHVLKPDITSLAILSGQQKRVLPILPEFQSNYEHQKHTCSIADLYHCPERLDFFVDVYEDDLDFEAEHKPTGETINILSHLHEKPLENRLNSLKPDQSIPPSWEHVLPPEELALLLCVRPDFCNDCDWTKFTSRELVLILVNRPSLARFCDWSKITGKDWATLLAEIPDLAEHCYWSKLDESDWTYLLNDRPWFIEHKPS